MMDEEIVKNMRDHWERELKAVPGARFWKLGGQEWEGLAELGVAQVEALGRFVPDEFRKIVRQTVEAIPTFRQPKPEEPPPMSKPWVNPITGQPLGLPKTPDEKAALKRKDPHLLKLMEDLEKRPYQTLVRLREEADRYARLASIRYGADEDQSNPFYGDKGADIEAQGALTRNDPDRAEVFKREAKTPVRIPWLNGGKRDPDGMGFLVRQAPEVAKLANRAIELIRQRAKAEAAAAQAEIQAAQAKLEQAKKLAAS